MTFIHTVIERYEHRNHHGNSNTVQIVLTYVKRNTDNATQTKQMRLHKRQFPKHRRRYIRRDGWLGCCTDAQRPLLTQHDFTKKKTKGFKTITNIY